MLPRTTSRIGATIGRFVVPLQDVPLKPSKSQSGGLVYSTAAGRICPGCRRPVAECVCKRPAAAPPRRDSVVRVSRQSKGRGGKTVSVVTGVPLDPAGLDALAKELRRACGSGGTVKEGTIEVQGDHCERLIGELEKRGWKPKRAGG